MTLPWLNADTPFPPTEFALSEPQGLLAAGADLSVERLRLAYANGIFPWYAEGEPILWWSPTPRMVLQCRNFSPSHSLRKRLRQLARNEIEGTPQVEVRVDTAFADVIQACAAPRPGQPGTWINVAMQQAYQEWHKQGQVHSIETWINGQLAGGLYGISLGGMFFGESMFARATDASKIALAYLLRFLLKHNVEWIDCQQQTRHLASLGATALPRHHFLDHVSQAILAPSPPWTAGRLDHTGALHPLKEDTDKI